MKIGNLIFKTKDWQFPLKNNSTGVAESQPETWRSWTFTSVAEVIILLLSLIIKPKSFLILYGDKPAHLCMFCPDVCVLWCINVCTIVCVHMRQHNIGQQVTHCVCVWIGGCWKAFQRQLEQGRWTCVCVEESWGVAVFHRAATALPGCSR